MKDSYNKLWNNSDNDPLGDYIIKNKLWMSIEYITEFGKVWFYLLVKKDINSKSKSKSKIILEIKQKYPLNDDEILSVIISTIRDKKINQLLK